MRAFTDRVSLPSTFHPILIIIIFNCLSLGRNRFNEVQPRYLATLAVAEQLYEALLTWDTLRAIDVTPISQTFFAQYVPGITGTYRALVVDHDVPAPFRSDPRIYRRLPRRCRATLPPTAGSQSSLTKPAAPQRAQSICGGVTRRCQRHSVRGRVVGQVALGVRKNSGVVC